MAKRNRPKISTTSKSNIEDAINIAESIVNEPEEKKKKAPKQPSKRFNLRIPNKLFERLEAVSEETGISKSAIVIQGLFSKLNELDKR